ncbi:MAG: helix-hairpin-helix domain-containing protein [bacterium]
MFNRIELKIFIFLLVSAVAGLLLNITASQEKSKPGVITVNSGKCSPYLDEEAAPIREKEAEKKDEHFISCIKRISVNNADIAELQSIKGVGPGLAGKIIKHRTKHGPFRKHEDLLSVKGIGKKTLVNLKQYIIIN